MAKLLNEQKHADQRMRLLTQARRLIANQGFKETSMSQIAEACEVTKATLYHYFDSKEAILLAILGCHEENIETLKAELAKASNLEDILLAIARNHMERMSRPENLEFLKILVNEAMTNPDVKKFYMGFITESLRSVSDELLGPILKGRMEGEALRRTYFQFIAGLAHYTWQVKMVGSLRDIIGDDEAYIRQLVKMHVHQFMNG
jgi:AcrR family transcriptional regulator